jgi:hypothetical protein
MKSIFQALKLYNLDQGGYPPMLLQVAEYNGATLRRIQDIRRGFLYRAKEKDISVFTGSIAGERPDILVQACWPNRDSRVNASQPGEYQAFGPGDLVRYTHLRIDPSALNGDAPTAAARFYAYDSYDVAPTFNPACVSAAGGKKYELRYVLFWTALGQAGGGPLDNTRQLGYNDPKDDTIVTWNTFFERGKGSPPLPTHGSNDTIVLYLNGSVRYHDGLDVYERSWRYGQ